MVPAAVQQPAVELPNNILFLTSLPNETTELMLSMLFNQYHFWTQLDCFINLMRHLLLRVSPSLLNLLICLPTPVFHSPRFWQLSCALAFCACLVVPLKVVHFKVTSDVMQFFMNFDRSLPGWRIVINDMLLLLFVSLFFFFLHFIITDFLDSKKFAWSQVVQTSLSWSSRMTYSQGQPKVLFRDSGLHHQMPWKSLMLRSDLPVVSLMFFLKQQILSI